MTLEEVANKLNKSDFRIFAKRLIENISSQYLLSQKEIAQQTQVIEPVISSLKHGSRTYSYKTELLFLNRLYYLFPVDIDSIVDEIVAEAMEKKIEEEKRRARNTIEFKGVIYSTENSKLLFLDIIFDIWDGKVNFDYNNEIYIGSFRVTENLSKISLHSNNNSDAILHINDYGYESFFQSNLIHTGSLTNFDNQNAKLYPIIILKSEILKESSNIEKCFRFYFENKQIQSAFSSINENSLNELIEIVNHFENNHVKTTLYIPKEIATSYKQFLDFFSEYVLVAKGKDIQFDTFKRGESLEVQVNTNEETTIDKVGEYLEEYMGFAKQNIDNLKINIETNLSDNEFNILILDLKHQVTSLKHSLDLAQLKNNMLDKEVDYFKQLTMGFANKDNIIHTQIIQGGEQQFADKIKNKES